MAKTRADYENEWRESVRLKLLGIEKLEVKFDKRIDDLGVKIDKRMDDQAKLLNDLQTSELATLKTQMAVLRAEFTLKSGLWGFAAGAIPSAAAALYVVLHK